jgi:hypothetical protein
VVPSNFFIPLIFAFQSPMMTVMTPPSPSGKIIFLGACLIAAVRLAREEKWDNSPRVVSRIADSIWLAERIFERMRNDPRHFNE